MRPHHGTMMATGSCSSSMYTIAHSHAWCRAAVPCSPPTAYQCQCARAAHLADLPWVLPACRCKPAFASRVQQQKQKQLAEQQAAQQAAQQQAAQQAAFQAMQQALMAAGAGAGVALAPAPAPACLMMVEQQQQQQESCSR